MPKRQNFTVDRKTGVRTVVKYLRESDYWRYWFRGKFKFGTLEEYRSYEGETQRLSDYEDGLSLRVLEQVPIPGEIGKFRLPDAVVGGHTFMGNEVFDSEAAIAQLTGKTLTRPRGIVISKAHNAHVMCFSLGPYSKAHHRSMMFGGTCIDGSSYQGDPELNMAIEIDLPDFIARVGRSFDKSKRVFGRPIDYGERRIAVQAAEIEHGIKPNDASKDFMQAVFTKGESFSVEAEYRLMLYNPDNTSIALGVGAHCFKSAHLLKSARSIYKVKQT